MISYTAGMPTPVRQSLLIENMTHTSVNENCTYADQKTIPVSAASGYVGIRQKPTDELITCTRARHASYLVAHFLCYDCGMNVCFPCLYSILCACDIFLYSSVCVLLSVFSIFSTYLCFLITASLYSANSLLNNIELMNVTNNPDPTKNSPVLTPSLSLPPSDGSKSTLPQFADDRSQEEDSALDSLLSLG